MKQRFSRREQGFTLLELLVVISIAGVLLTIGFFAYRNWVTNQQFQDIRRNVVDVITRARSDARRTSQDQMVRWTNGLGGRIVIINNVSNERERYDWPADIRVRRIDENGSVYRNDDRDITYTAPFGRLEVDGLGLTEPVILSIEDDTHNLFSRVYIYGVTGDIVVKAQCERRQVCD